MGRGPRARMSRVCLEAHTKRFFGFSSIYTRARAYIKTTFVELLYIYTQNATSTHMCVISLVKRVSPPPPLDIPVKYQEKLQNICP